MDTQPTANCCPKCQIPLPPDAPQGLCPKCLFAAVATPTEADQPAGHRPTPPALTEIAAAFPQLEILEFIGQGGMGFVFKARQPNLDRLVALKILPRSLAADPTFAERFNREAKLLARLNHPGIVAVHDFGVATGRADLPVRQGIEAVQQHRPASQFYYLLMEFVDGVNLRQAMQAGRFTPDQALAIVPKICEALQFAHNEGILHRDIKPENILLDAKGRVKIADFGIAKLMERGCVADQPQHDGVDKELRLTGDGTAALPNLTEAGKTLGSPNYMAPEQLEHPGEVDHRADIYSLGVVFYEMLTGELPLGRFAPPSQKSAADPRVDEVVLRALEKERERRQHSAGEVRTQVETIAATPLGGSRGQPRQAELKAGEEDQTKSKKSGDSRLTGFQILLRSVVIAVAAGLLVFALAAAVTSLLPRTYAATARVELSSQDPNFLQNEFARMESPEFLKQVEAAADLKRRWKSSLSGSEAEQTEQIIVRLRNEMELRPVRNTRLIVISFYSESPGEATDIANAITTVYCSQPGTRIVGIAEVPARPVRPNAMLHLAIGVVGGGFFGLVAGGLTALFLIRRRSHPSSGSRRMEARTEKSEIENRKSEIAPRFSRTAIIVAVWLVIIGSVVTFALARNHIAKPTGMPLSATEFLQKFEANQIARATVSYDPQLPGVAKISGTYYRTDKDGNIVITEKGVPFIVENALITPNLERKLVRSDKIVFNTPNPIPTAIAYNLLFFGGFGMVILLLLGIIIYVVSRVIKRPIGVPVPPVQKPDRFWRWFVVTTLAMIVVIFSVAILGLLAAIAIPNYVKARAQPQANAQRAAALTSADFHWRIFEADAALVDRLIPAGQRQHGVQSTAKAYLKYSGGGGSREVNNGTNSFKVTMSKGPEIDSWFANISLETLNALLYGIGNKTNILADGTQTISGVWWPSGMPTIWNYSRQDGVFYRGGGGGINLAIRQLDGHNEIRVEGEVHHQTDLNEIAGITSKFLYEGKAPQNGALAFLVPFFRKDDSEHYLVVVYEVGHTASTTTSTAAAQNLSFGPGMPASALQFRLVVPEDSTEPAEDLPGISGSDRFHVLREALLDGSAVAQAGVDFSPDGTRRIEIQFTAAGKQRFAEITGANINRQLAVLFRGKVLFAPFIRSAITGGQCSIDSNISREEVYALLDCLNRNTTASDPGWKFAAPRERILPFQPRPGFLVGWLDLDSGMVLTNSILDWQTHAGHEWIRSNSLDLASTDSSKEIQVLLGFDAIILAAPTNGWDTVTAVDVVDNWNLLQDEPQQMKMFGAKSGQSETYFFRTREGGMGVLQITGFTENPRGVKLRYKLVKNPMAATANYPGDWVWEMNSSTLDRVPPICLLRPTTMPTNWVPGDMFGDGRYLARGKTVRELIATVWAQKNSALKIVFAGDLPVGRYDFIVTAQPQWWDTLQAEIDRRFFLVEQIENRDGTDVLVVKNVSLIEPPKLQFIAWNDEWLTNRPGAARHHDGSQVTNVTELNWLKEVLPGGCVKSKPDDRFLSLWVSHPAFTQADFTELLDGNGQPFPFGNLFYGFYAADGKVGGEQYADLPFRCWKCWTICPDNTNNELSRITLRLRYTIGPLEKTQELSELQFRYPMLLLEGGGQFNGVGQNTDGNAFVAITVDGDKLQARRFGVQAITKDGREIMSSGGMSGNVGGTGVQMVNFVFDVPLASVAKFIIGTRPVRTAEWTNVVLPGN